MFKSDLLAGRRILWALFLLAVCVSCHIHLVGAARGDQGWTGRVFAAKQDDLPTVWKCRDSQLAWTLIGPR